jgi:hypothetical protein
MQYEDTIEIRGMTVMPQTDGALLCRMGNQHRSIAPTQFQPGSSVARQGDVGMMVLKRFQGLVHPQSRHEPRAGVISVDRYSPLRERIIRLRGSRLMLLGILVAPLVMAGYVTLAVLLFLPLLGLRRIFRRRATPAIVRWDGGAPRYSGVGNLCDAATRSA